MPRRPRFEEAGAVHHVYARGVERRAIFLDDVDRVVYLDLLGFVVREWRWDCFAYCLMDNHIHLLIRTPEPNLGLGMQRFHSMYAQQFNERHARVGHLFQGRYGSSRIRTPQRLAYVTEYIDANPVKAGFCADPSDWFWSSSGAVNSGDAPRWLRKPRALAALYDELAADS
jgi:REP element-mobilizing transposase RayT